MTRTVKRRKVKKKSLLLFFSILICLFVLVYYVLNFHITNIYIKGNTIYSDQEIIDRAKLSNYPRTLNNNELVIKKRLESDPIIRRVRVIKKNLLREVYISIDENKPLFIYNNQVILNNGQAIELDIDIPVLINDIPDTKIKQEVYKSFVKIDSFVYGRISEIKYDPNDKDNNRFLFMMNDGNYVYITLRKIERINNYVEIISAFEGKKGILYLDSGEYFELFGG